MKRAEELFTFRVREGSAVFDYRAIHTQAGDYRLDKRGMRSGNWQTVMRSQDEQAMIRAYKALTITFGELVDPAPPAWIAERLSA